MCVFSISYIWVYSSVFKEFPSLYMKNNPNNSMIRMMKKTEKVPFVGMLETSLNRRWLSPKQTTLDSAYEDYIDMLHNLIS